MYYPDVPALEPEELELLCHEYVEHNATLDPHLADQMGVKRGLRNLDGTGVLAGIIVGIAGTLLVIRLRKRQKKDVQ